MPHFFFNLVDAGKHFRDDTGSEFADEGAARDAAQRALMDISRDRLPRADDMHAFEMNVTDANGRAVYSATLSYAGRMANG